MQKVEAGYKHIWAIAWPIIAGSVSQTALNLTDTAFLGRVGEVELGASAIAGVFYFVLVMMGVAIGIGSQILIARRIGEGRPHQAGNIFDHTLIILSAGGLILMFTLYILTPRLFSIIIESEEIRNAATEYILFRSWAIWPALLLAGCRGFFIGIARTKIISIGSAIMLAVNALLDYVLIFGKWGAPQMGIAGAGLASGIAETLTALFMLGYVRMNTGFGIYKIFHFNPVQKINFRSVINLSLPVMLQNFISMGAWFVFFILIERMGSRELAVSNIVRATYMVLMTPMWGFSSAASSLVSNVIGQQKQHQIFSLIKKIIRMSFWFSFIIGIVFASFPDPVLSLVTNDRILIEQAYGTYYLTCGAILVFSISLVLFSAVSGTGNTQMAMWIESVNILIYLLYVYTCIFWCNTSLEWVWFSEILYWLLMGIFSFIYLRSGHWKKIRI
jgi:putative efflux protein, MATE family